MTAARDTRRGLLALAVVGVALSCAGPPATDRLVRGLRLDDWSQAEVFGLTLATNADPARLQDTIASLRAYLSLVTGLLFDGRFQPDRPAHVLFFEDLRQYRAFGSAATTGHTLPGEEERTVAVSLALAGAGLAPDNVAVLYHELAHLLLFNHAGRRYPLWFHEGFAEFFGAAIVRDDLATLGGLPPARVDVIRRSEPLPLARLLDVESAYPTTAAETERFYADAWAFVHYGLLSHTQGGRPRTRQFLAFVGDTSRGSDWLPALEHAFDASLAEIDAEYRRHRSRLASSRVNRQIHVEVPPPDAPTAFTPMARSEIATRLGRYALALSGEPRDRTAAGLFDVALQADAPPLAAQLGRVRVAAQRDELGVADSVWLRIPSGARSGAPAQRARGELELARARRAEREGRDPGEALHDARRAFERVLEQAPGDHAALLGIGHSYLAAPRGEDVAPGIEALQQAVSLTPDHPQPRLLLARLLLRDQRPEAAASELRQLMAAAPDSEIAREAERLLREAVPE